MPAGAPLSLVVRPSTAVARRTVCSSARGSERHARSPRPVSAVASISDSADGSMPSPAGPPSTDRREPDGASATDRSASEPRSPTAMRRRRLRPEPRRGGPRGEEGVLQRGVDQLLIAAPALQARRQPSRVPRGRARGAAPGHHRRSVRAAFGRRRRTVPGSAWWSHRGCRGHRVDPHTRACPSTAERLSHDLVPVECGLQLWQVRARAGRVQWRVVRLNGWSS